MMVSTRLLRQTPRPIRDMQATVGARLGAVIAAGSQLVRRAAGVCRRDACAAVVPWYDSLWHDDRSAVPTYLFRRDANAVNPRRRAHPQLGARALAWARQGSRRPRPATQPSLPPGEASERRRAVDRCRAAPRRAHRDPESCSARRRLRHTQRFRLWPDRVEDSRCPGSPRSPLPLDPLPATGVEDRLGGSAAAPAADQFRPRDQSPPRDRRPDLLLGRRPPPRTRRRVGDVPAEPAAGLGVDAGPGTAAAHHARAARDPGRPRRNDRLAPGGQRARRADRAERARRGSTGAARGTHPHRTRDARRRRPPHVADRRPGRDGPVPAGRPEREREERVRRVERHRAGSAERRATAPRGSPQRRACRACAPAEARRRRGAGRSVATCRGERRPLDACERRQLRSPMRSGFVRTASFRRRSRTPAGILPERGFRLRSSATRIFSDSTSSTARRPRPVRYRSKRAGRAMASPA